MLRTMLTVFLATSITMLVWIVQNFFKENRLTLAIVMLSAIFLLAFCGALLYKIYKYIRDL